jgi:AraC-like DNA-binding protein
MSTKIGYFNLQWLFAPETPGGVSADESLSVRRLDYNIPSEIGEAWLDALELNDGISLYRAVHHLEKSPFGQLVPVLEVKTNKTELTFCAQTWLSGIGCHHEYWQGRNAAPVEIWGRPGVDTFRLNQAWDARVLIEGGGMTEMRSFIITHPLLQSLLGDSAETALIEKLGLDGQIQAITCEIPAHINIPLLEAMSERYAGPARRLFAQARALEYLGGLVSFLQVDDRKPSQRRHTQKIRELKECLLSLDGRIPALNQLAKDFGLSAKQLNIEFKAEFGQSIFEFVTANRLEQARAALLESNIPMKVISERLGYSHVNHFITAFKRKFGFPPGSVRKGC